MQIQKSPKKNKKIIVVLSLIVAGFVLAGAAFLAWQRFGSAPQNSDVAPVNTVDYGPPKEQDQNDPSLPDSNDLGETKNPNQPTPPPPSGVAITISRADQAGAGQDLNIRTVVNGTKQGTCTATLTKAGQAPVTKSGQVAYEVSTAHCNFDIPAQNFPVGEAWELSVAINSNEGNNTATQSVSIMK